MLIRGVPEYMRTDNGSQFTANEIRKQLRGAGSTTAYIEPGSPWENGHIESFNARMRAEFLNGELFDTMYEAQVVEVAPKTLCKRKMSDNFYLS